MNELNLVECYKQRIEELEHERDALLAHIEHLTQLWPPLSADISALFDQQPQNQNDGSYLVDGQSVYEFVKVLNNSPEASLVHRDTIKKAEALEALSQQFSLNVENARENHYHWSADAMQDAADEALHEAVKYRTQLVESDNLVVEQLINESSSKERPSMSNFKTDMIDAVKVQFLKQIFEDDFPERGMKAWLTKIEHVPENDDVGIVGYRLFFDFKDFEEENDKYFSECYYWTSHCGERLNYTKLYTAIEAGHYTRKYNVYYDEVSGAEEGELPGLENYLRILED